MHAFHVVLANGVQQQGHHQAMFVWTAVKENGVQILWQPRSFHVRTAQAANLVMFLELTAPLYVLRVLLDLGLRMELLLVLLAKLASGTISRCQIVYRIVWIVFRAPITPKLVLLQSMSVQLVAWGNLAPLKERHRMLCAYYAVQENGVMSQLLDLPHSVKSAYLELQIELLGCQLSLRA